MNIRRTEMSIRALLGACEGTNPTIAARWTPHERVRGRADGARQGCRSASWQRVCPSLTMEAVGCHAVLEGGLERTMMRRRLVVSAKTVSVGAR